MTIKTSSYQPIQRSTGHATWSGHLRALLHTPRRYILNEKHTIFLKIFNLTPSQIFKHDRRLLIHLPKIP